MPLIPGAAADEVDERLGVLQTLSAPRAGAKHGIGLAGAVDARLRHAGNVAFAVGVADADEHRVSPDRTGRHADCKCK